MVQNMANTVCSANADGKCRRITGENKQNTAQQTKDHQPINSPR